MQLFDPPNILSETNLEGTIYSKEANNSMNIYNVQLQVIISQSSKIGNYSPSNPWKQPFKSKGTQRFRHAQVVQEDTISLSLVEI